MVFSSLTFLFVFFPTLLVFYFFVPARLREVRNFILLAFSLFFYVYAGPSFLLLMIASIAVNYLLGILVTLPRRKKLALVLSVVLNLGFLGWFKYAGFLAGNLALLFPTLPIPTIILPIGISFFTFQGMSYVFDIARGQAEVQKNPFHVALYIALFPQLVAGPIVRYTTVAEEIVQRRESVSDFAEGAVRFCFGLSKKMLLANPLGQIADAAFALSPAALSPGMAWLGILAYAGQIYFDFSAYSDMAIGMGRIFGFHFLENFNYPYAALSVADFWRRWHISLSTWFRDYVYIPLGGNRCSTGRHIFNLLCVWALTGLWHGAAWNFLLWGMYYGLLLIGERYLWGRLLERWPSLLRRALTLFLLLVGWVLFRAESAAQIGTYLAAMFGRFGAEAAPGQLVYLLLEYRLELLIGLIACMPLKPALERVLTRRETAPRRVLLAWGAPALALVLFLFSLARMLGSTFNPFIYFRF